MLTKEGDDSVLTSELFLPGLSSPSFVVGSLEGARKGLSSGFLASWGLLVVGVVSLVVVCTSFAVSGEWDVWKENEDLMDVCICLFSESGFGVCDGAKNENVDVDEGDAEGRGDGRVDAGRAVEGLKVVTGGGLGRIIILLSSLIFTPSTSACIMWMPCSASRLLRLSKLAAILYTLSLLLLVFVASFIISVRLSITTCSGVLTVVVVVGGGVVVVVVVVVVVKTTRGVVDDVNLSVVVRGCCVVVVVVVVVVGMVVVGVVVVVVVEVEAWVPCGGVVEALW